MLENGDHYYRRERKTGLSAGDKYYNEEVNVSLEVTLMEKHFLTDDSDTKLAGIKLIVTGFM